MLARCGPVGLAVNMAVLMAGCSSNAQFAIERRLPAPVALPEVRRLGVVAFDSRSSDKKASEALAAAIRARIEKDGGFLAADPARLDVRGASSDAEIAAKAGPSGVDAILVGEIGTLDVSRVLEAPTIITKTSPDGAKEFPTTRKLKTGMLRASFRVVLPDGRVRRGRAIATDVRAERIEDPEPRLMTIAPREFPQDAMPSDEQVVARLVEAAAASIVREIAPRREPAVVTWESAGDAEGESRRLFAEGEYDKAASELSWAVGERKLDGLRERLGMRPRLSAEEKAALLYDLALCEDALGDLEKAERHFDEALTLWNSELHQSALRGLRSRAAALRREDAR